MLSRRQFLQSSPLVSLVPLVPSMLTAAARAAEVTPDTRSLVVIQLDGGNDGLNTVVPFRDDGYARHRRALRIEADRLLRLTDDLGLHPDMRGAKELFDDGELMIAQGVGYPNPSRSHFRSMKIWQSASLDEADHDGNGWLGRALDRSPPADLARPADSAGVYVGESETPLALWGRRSTATALSRAEDLHLQLEEAGLLSVQAGDRPLEQFLTQQVYSAYAAALEFARQESRRNSETGGRYPETKLAAQLRLIAQLIRSGSRARVYYTVQSGYDTHSQQLATHARLLSELAGGLKAFFDDLRAARLDEQVVVMAFSEFGRRVQENDSLGTDHGTAGPVFLAGSALRGGLLGSAPDLSQLDGGDLRMQFDFRQVYATLLDCWLEIPSRDVLSEPFEQLPLFRKQAI